MKLPTKTLLAGLALGAVALTAGFVNTRHLQAKVDALHAKCVAEGEKEASALGSYSALAAQFGGKLVCDPTELLNSNGSNNTSGTQAQLVIAQRELHDAMQWPIPLGVAIVCLLGIPFAWYFLLRRLKEIREALSRQSDT